MLTSASRPPTSKPRGVCRYYTHPRGCFAGDKCKFLHGESSQATPEQPLLTPYDKSKTCRYYQNGFCRRGDKCWFLHVVGNNIQGEGSIVLEEPSDDDLCSVCFEKPVTFGLLTGCSHVFCITCIRQWRDPSGKGGDMVDSGNTKKCPMCRTPSRFITPSSRFFKQEDPEKDKIVQTYKESMAKVPCRYFRQSKQKDKNNLLCPFGKDCFYQHLNDDGTPYIFKDGVEVCMGRHRSRNNRSVHSEAFLPFQLSFNGAFDVLLSSNEMDFSVPWRRNENSNSLNNSADIRMLEAFNNVISDNGGAGALSAAIEVFRRGLSGGNDNSNAYRRRHTTQLDDGWGPVDDYDDEDEDTEENVVMERLELLADEMLVSLSNFPIGTDPESSDESENLPPLEPFISVVTQNQSNIDNASNQNTATPARWAFGDDEEDGDDLPSLRSVSNSSSGGDEYDDSETDDDNIGNEVTDDEESVGHPRAFDLAYNAVNAAREERMRERLERLGQTWPLHRFMNVSNTSTGQVSHEEHTSLFSRNNGSSSGLDDDNLHLPHNNSHEEVLEQADQSSSLDTATAQEPYLSNTLVSEPPFVTDGRGRVVGASPGSTNSVYRDTMSTSTVISSRLSQRRKPSIPTSESLETNEEFTTDGRGRVVSVGNAGSSRGSSEVTGAEQSSSSTPGTDSQRSFIGRMLDALF